MSAIAREQLVLGGFLLALWLDVRFETRRPASLGGRMRHCFVAVVAVNLSPVAIAALAGPDAGAHRRLALIFVAFLPCLVYASLAAVWLLRSLADVLRTYA